MLFTVADNDRAVHGRERLRAYSRSRLGASRDERGHQDDPDHPNMGARKPKTPEAVSRLGGDVQVSWEHRIAQGNAHQENVMAELRKRGWMRATRPVMAPMVDFDAGPLRPRPGTGDGTPNSQAATWVVQAKARKFDRRHDRGRARAGLSDGSPSRAVSAPGSSPSVPQFSWPAHHTTGHTASGPVVAQQPIRHMDIYARYLQFVKSSGNMWLAPIRAQLMCSFAKRPSKPVTLAVS